MKQIYTAAAHCSGSRRCTSRERSKGERELVVALDNEEEEEKFANGDELNPSTALLLSRAEKGSKKTPSKPNPVKAATALGLPSRSLETSHRRHLEEQ